MNLVLYKIVLLVCNFSFLIPSNRNTDNKINNKPVILYVLLRGGIHLKRMETCEVTKRGDQLSAGWEDPVSTYKKY